MPIDTSSYYPEVNDPDGKKDKESLNGVHTSLFGDTPKVEEVIIEEKIIDSLEPSEPSKDSELPWEKVVNGFSHFLSWIFVPLIMPVFGILFIFRLSILDVIPAGLQTAVTFVIAGINFFAPMLLIFLLKLMGVVQDVGLNGQKERLIPYIITALCYGASAWFVASRGAPVWVAMFFCGGVVASVINLFINLKWKISAHAAAIAGLVALLIRLQRDVAVEPKLFLWLIITVGCAGLLGSARVWLNRHTVWQVLAGYAVGFCAVFFMMYIH
ncbi:MAG: phosphatase PAP2 family protein [Muribaculaceae bacterium]|nr:phosphatase PAP2 family protein [Muribaculaceae bacterium]